MEGRGGRRRSRSFAGASGSPRLSAAASPPSGPPPHPSGLASNAATVGGKRKRSLSGSMAAAATAPAGNLDAGLPSLGGAGAMEVDEGGKEEGQGVSLEEAAERRRERERAVEEEQEAAISLARPAIVFCRVVDAMQRVLKSGAGAGGGGAEVFLAGGDDLLQAASREAHAAYESAVAPVGRGGGVEEGINAMGLRGRFAEAVGVMTAGGDEEGGKMEEKELVAACRKRVMNLLCEGELSAVSSSRSS